MNQILYVQKKLNSNKLIIGLSILLIFCIAFLSTIFSILNINNPNIISGISINNVDISNLSKEDAKAKLISELTLPDNSKTVDIIVNNTTYTTPISNIGISPDYDAMVEVAYNTGRNKSFIANNFIIQQSYMFGNKLNAVFIINDDIFNNLILTLKENINETKLDDSYTIEENYITITKGIDGIALNIDKLKADIIDSFNKNNITTISTEITSSKAIRIDLDALYDQITTEPIDASTIVENDTIIFKTHVDGITFNLSDAKFLYNNSAENIIKIPLTITKAQITADSLVQEMFKDTLTTYSTNYKESEKNRTNNVKLASNKINGVILLPGQEFSFNKIVGERSTENGFKSATMFANNALTQSIGGGICQVSSTLYNNTLLLNLNISERRNHQLAVGYVPLGRDSTIVWDTTDLKFINNRTTPIKIVSTCNNGTLTISFLGTKGNNEPQVTIKTVTDSTKQFETQTIEDSSMEQGKTIVTQNGAYGYTVSTYLITSLDGKEISNTLISKDTYNPLTKIVKIGTKKVTPVTQPSDTPVTEPSDTPNSNTSDSPSQGGQIVPPGWDVPENPYL